MSARLHLTFPRHLSQEPVIYRVGKDFGLVTTIRKANIDDSLWSPTQEWLKVGIDLTL